MSVAQAAFSTAVRIMGGPWDPLAQASAAQEEMRKLQTQQAAGKVLIVRDVPYTPRASHKQMSDIYLPAGKRAGLPLVIHFHGGGWSHGDRQHELFGSPAVARSHAAAGCVVVTPSYRLGDSTTFMHDARRAVLWAVANATALGADPERLYLSGHSAGGNIAALLGVGPWLAPPVLPLGAVKGVIGISGVYTLKSPLGGLPACYKNRQFEHRLRKPIFGDEDATLAKYSPTALVRLGGGERAPFKPRWPEALVGTLGSLFRNSLSVVPLAPPDDKPSSSANDSLPPVLLINASWDLGLEDDAAYFAKVCKARTGTKPAHHIVPNTNHATVSWDETTFRKSRDFIAACEAARGGSWP